MTLRAKEELAMVLPLPVKPGSGEKAVRFIDLKDYPDFFTDLRKGFPEPLAQPTPGRTRSLGAAPEAKLEVVTVGNQTAFETARAEGRAMPVVQAIALARQQTLLRG